MKVTAMSVFAIILAMSFSVAYGQQKGPAAGMNALIPTGRGGAFVGSPGDYNVKMQDNTSVANKILDNAQINQGVDRDYLINVVDGFNAQIKALLDLQQKYSQLSQTAATSATQNSFQAYLDLTNLINNKNQSLYADLQSRSMISRESLPSYEPINAGGMQATAARTGDINFGPLVAKVDNLRAGIIVAINQTTFLHLLTPVGQPVAVTENALKPNLTGIKILSQEQVDQYESDIQLAMVPLKKTRGFYQNYQDETVNVINSFIKNVGTSEWLRFQDDNDAKAAGKYFVQLTDIFYRKSYLRKQYHVRQGGVQPDPVRGYPKKIANIDRFLIQPLKEAIGAIDRTPAIVDHEVQDAYENTRNFVQLYDEKATPVLESKADIMKAKKGEYSITDVGFIVRANSTLTYLTGQRKTAEVLLAVMRLVLSDLTEEMMMLQNDYAAQASYHDAKYRSTPENKLEANKKICMIDWNLSPGAFQKNCVPLGIKFQPGRPENLTGTSITEIFSNILGQIVDVEFNRRQDADLKHQLIIANNEAAMTPEQKKQKETEQDDAFN